MWHGRLVVLHSKYGCKGALDGFHSGIYLDSVARHVVGTGAGIAAKWRPRHRGSKQQ